MNTRLTTYAQVSLLKEGDIIKRFPFFKTESLNNVLPENSPGHISTFQIQSINPKNDMFFLISSKVRTLVLSTPVDIAGYLSKELTW